ncbi:MAG: pyroglutamyl-peptidase I [Deltaproteobacteria bacterium]|nr:pyroglutamyl-peptidase I [Deltaproteobacteria bacterium]
MSGVATPRVLLTSFAPFGGLPHNPSERVMSLVGTIDGASIETRVLPVETRRVREVLEPDFAAGFDVVIHTGVAMDRPTITVERVAINLLDFEARDEGGELRVEEPIDPDGPFALRSRIPVRAIVKAWGSAGIPGRASNSAGTFLCNQVMYLALSKLPSMTRAGFIHVAPDEHLGGGRPHQPAELQARAVRLAIGVCLNELREELSTRPSR